MSRFDRRCFLKMSAASVGAMGAVSCRRRKDDDAVTTVAKAKIHAKEARIPLDEYPSLEKDGNAVVITERAARPPLLLVREDGEVRAFMNLCTHAACPLMYDAARRLIVCNPDCGHGSVFGLDGSVVSGPAPRPLFRFDAEFDADGRNLKVRLRLRTG